LYPTSLFSHSFFLMLLPPPTSTLFPYTTLFRSRATVMPAQAPAVSTDFVPFDCRLENLPGAGCRACVSAARDESPKGEAGASQWPRPALRTRRLRCATRMAGERVIRRWVGRRAHARGWC